MAEATAKEKVLVLMPDADERSTLVEAALEPFGYSVRQTGDGNEAMAILLNDKPDVLLMDLHPEGLSGLDILAGIGARSMDVPVIVVANAGSEKDALGAFRLGAKDYITRPVREAELIQVIERAMKEVRIRKEREGLLNQVRRAAQAAEQRLREMRTLMGIGKSVTALTNLNQVFDHVGRAALQLSSAEAMGLLLRDDASGNLQLRHGANLPSSVMEYLGRPVRDDLASLVMNSKEPYRVAGEGIKRFNPVFPQAGALMYAPMVVNEASIGVLWVANSKTEFQEQMGPLLVALADYAAIAVVNSRLFSEMQENARRAQSTQQRLNLQQEGAAAIEKLPQIIASLREPLEKLSRNLHLFSSGEMGAIAPAQQASVDVMNRQVEELKAQIAILIPPTQS